MAETRLPPPLTDLEREGLKHFKNCEECKAKFAQMARLGAATRGIARNPAASLSRRPAKVIDMLEWLTGKAGA
jgi:predicted anti-sigma-YlaC factor YlaD